MNRRRLLLAAGWGLAPLAVVLWAFFAPRTQGAPAVGHPLRGLVPFAAIASTGAALGATWPTAGPHVGSAAAAPGLVVGAALGVGAALSPEDLVVVAGLSLLYVALGAVGGWLGARLRASRMLSGG